MVDEPIYLILRKGEEAYCFCYRKSTRKDLEAILLRFAANADLSFSWHDVATLLRVIRGEQEGGLLSANDNAIERCLGRDGN